ncbi:MAG: UvrD-helicase domain-containing protein, partial [Lentisphaeria bacterium]|nr:UvrD-helicase domain-containing protein [Lentisphaeria bacterium]
MTRWTTDQNAAIEAKVGPVLVSAAAGSGKTAVLVERVLRRLTDPIQPLDLDRFLLVTFTNAAASEMRAKLGAAMMARLIEEPENARLRRQMLLLQKADITTMH